MYSSILPVYLALLSIIHPQGCEREVAEATKSDSDDQKSECIMRLSWALVHSRNPADVQRGIAMLEGESFTYFSLELSFAFRFFR